MADISEINDIDELENRWLDKVIVYVEAEADSHVYTKLVGPNLADRLEFKPPPESTGYLAVMTRVADERQRNTKVFGLLDGEASATCGGLDRLVASEGVLFDVPENPGTTGLFFLHVHELENLLILYGDLFEHVCRDVRLTDIGKRSPEDVQDLLGKATRRFFSSALAKYAGGEVRASGSEVNLIDAGQFLDMKQTTTSILRKFRAYIDGAGGSWTDYTDIARRVLKDLAERFDAEGLEEDGRRLHFVRLADGKGLLQSLKSQYKPSTTWDGSLIENLLKNDYAGQFRQALLERVELAEAA